MVPTRLLITAGIAIAVATSAQAERKSRTGAVCTTNDTIEVTVDKSDGTKQKCTFDTCEYTKADGTVVTELSNKRDCHAASKMPSDVIRRIEPGGILAPN